MYNNVALEGKVIASSVGFWLNSVSLLRAAEKVDDELYWIFLLGAMIFATTLPFFSKI